jgi:hypothetical protein
MEYLNALKRRSIRLTLGAMLVPFALAAVAAQWLA